MIWKPTRNSCGSN